jgi:hypothetical protein
MAKAMAREAAVPFLFMSSFRVPIGVLRPDQAIARRDHGQPIAHPLVSSSVACAFFPKK